MLELSGLGKRYGRTWALRDVTCRLEAGQWVGVVGPNGSGKTTLLDLLSGLVRPTEGTLRVAGVRLREDRVDLKARVGVVGHDPGLYDELTVLENLRFQGRLHGLARAEADRRAERLADRLGVATRLHDRAGHLSRGLRQRTALARALVHDPDVLLLDEPFTGLDPDAARRLHGLLAEADDGRRLLVATAHDVAAVPGARRVLLLDRGEVVFDGAPDAAARRAEALYGGPVGTPGRTGSDPGTPVPPRAPTDAAAPQVDHGTAEPPAEEAPP